MRNAIVRVGVTTKQDVRHFVRQLRRTPVVAVLTVLTLAMGIGATLAIFTVVNAVLLRPLPFPNADRIIEIGHRAPGLTQTFMQSSSGLIAYYRESAPTLLRIAGYRMRDVNLTSTGTPERVRTLAGTPELFEVLGVQPVLGRAFVDADTQPQGAQRVALLSYSFWQSRFGGDRAIVGRRIDLDGAQVDVIGVMPAGVIFPDPSASAVTPGPSGLREAQLWMPLRLNPPASFGDFGVGTVALLQPGTTFEQARQEIDALQRRVSERFGVPQTVLDGWGWAVTVQRLRDSIIGDMSRPLWLLLGAVGLLLIVAGANVANLFLVRTEARWNEFAIRSALGASRGRLARTLFTESILIGLVGGVIGVVMAWTGIRLLTIYAPADVPRLHEVSVDGTVLLCALVLSVLVGVTVWVFPTGRLLRRHTAGALSLEASRGNTLGRERHRVRYALIAGQVALALVLLVGCGLLLRSVGQLYRLETGVTTDGLVTVGVSGGARDRASAVTVYHRILDEMASTPGVTSVGATNLLPFEATRMSGSGISVQSRPPTALEARPIARYKAITAGYFETLGMPLLEGRLPVRADDDQGLPVVWVNETFVRELLGDRRIGEQLNIEGRALEIVGVVGDVREFGFHAPIAPTAYLPIGLVPSVDTTLMYIVARMGTAPSRALVRAAVDRVDPSVPITAVRTMDDIVEASLAQLSFTTTLLVLAAVVTTLLAVIGLYAVTRYVVGQRTKEMGIRLALGASPQHVRALILRQSAGAALAGVLLGLFAAYILSRVMASLLFEVSPSDPATFGAAALALAAVSVIATYASAHRATRIDPAVALKYE